MFLRQVLDRILTMPDLAGISRNQTKPTVAEVRQPQASDESSPLQRTKRKVKLNIGVIKQPKVNSFASLTAICVRLV